MSDEEETMSNKEKETPPTNIDIELGDIIELVSTNPEINETLFYVDYIDPYEIQLLMTHSDNRYKLSVEKGMITDPTLREIHLVNRSEEKGYARQNGLNIDQWIEMHFLHQAGSITGKITNVEQDMIEFLPLNYTEPYYINFAYQGIPKNLPIQQIVLIEPPAIQGTLTADSRMEINSEVATIDYLDDGQAVIRTTEHMRIEPNPHDELQQLFLTDIDLLQGEDFVLYAEIPHEEKRYSLEAQTTDLMDSLLTKIPIYQRTPTVLLEIYNRIERFKQLRHDFFDFDMAGFVKGIHKNTSKKPLLTDAGNIKHNVSWIIPVASLSRKLYLDADEKDEEEEEEAGEGARPTILTLGNELETQIKLETIKPTYGENQVYYDVYNKETSYFQRPFISGNKDDSTTVVPIGQEIFITDNSNKTCPVIRRERLSSSNQVVQRITEIDDYVTNINSIITLPRPVMEYSRRDLFSTNILTKAGLGLIPFYLFLINTKIKQIAPLRQQTQQQQQQQQQTQQQQQQKRPPKITLDMRKEEQKKYVEKNAFQIYQYTNTTNTNEDDSQLWEQVIPSNDVAVAFVENQLTNSYSVFDMVRLLEPFGIGHDDIRFPQYAQIKQILYEKNKTFQTTFRTQLRNFQQFQQKLQTANRSTKKSNAIVQLVATDDKEFAERLSAMWSIYTNDPTMITSSSETLVNILSVDMGILYTTFLSFMMLYLITPDKLIDRLSKPVLENISLLEKMTANDPCRRRFMTKKYTSEDMLKKDNGKDINYDKIYDDTPYDIIKKYEKKRKQYLEEDFREFLRQTLVDVHDCPEEMSGELADTLIRGTKRVQNGEYAVLELTPKLFSSINPNSLSPEELKQVERESKNKRKYLYYIRKDDIWTRDETMPDEKPENQTAFCNSDTQCVKEPSLHTCEKDSLDVIDKKLEIIDLQETARKQYHISVESKKQQLLERAIAWIVSLRRKQRIMRLQYRRNDVIAFGIGKQVLPTPEIRESPYLELRTMILSDSDFVEKQRNIVRFYVKFCRPAAQGQGQEKESPHWGYCIETDTPLFPVSLYRLAVGFQNGEFNMVLDQLIAEVGSPSDDNESIVDKYTGYVLCRTDFETEEGYDEAGYKIVSHAVMEEHIADIALDEIRKEDIVNKTKENRRTLAEENSTAQQIYRVYDVVTERLAIQNDDMEDFVISHALRFIEQSMPSEKQYKRDNEKLLEAKKVPMYKKYVQLTILIKTAGLLFFRIQTAIPSILPKKRIANCVASFAGFPLMGGEENISGLLFMECIMHGIEGISKTDIWSAIIRRPGSLWKPMVVFLKSILFEEISMDSIMVQMYREKKEYLLSQPESDIPDELRVTRWTRFQPPLSDCFISSTLKPLTEEHGTELLRELKQGDPHQHDSIHAFISKIMYFTYGICEKVQAVVQHKEKVLSAVYLENACCNELDMATSPIEYFIQEEPAIKLYIASAKKYEELLQSAISKISMLYYSTLPNISMAVSPEKYSKEIVYSAFIHYCHFDTSYPCPLDLSTVCSVRPHDYDINQSLSAKIEFLEKRGIHFDLSQCTELMRLIYRRKMIKVDETQIVPPPQIKSFQNFLEQIRSNKRTLPPFENRFLDILQKTLMKYNDDVHQYVPTNQVEHAYNEDVIELNEYLLEVTQTQTQTQDSMYETVHRFITEYGAKSQKDRDSIFTFLQNPLNQITFESDMQRIRNAIFTMVHVSPEMILRRRPISDISIANHWGFSADHIAELQTFFQDSYGELNAFMTANVTGMDLFHVFLEKIKVQCSNYALFIRHIPTYRTLEAFGKTFYSVLSERTLQLLMKYILYSTLYQMIQILYNDQTFLKELNQGEEGEEEEEDDGDTDELIRIDVYPDLSDNVKNTLRKQVALWMETLLLSEYTNQQTIHYTYDDIKRETFKTVEKEKDDKIMKLSRMSKQERSLEQLRSHLKLGDAFVKTGDVRFYNKANRNRFVGDVIEETADDDGEQIGDEDEGEEGGEGEGEEDEEEGNEQIDVEYMLEEVDDGFGESDDINDSGVYVPDEN